MNEATLNPCSPDAGLAAQPGFQAAAGARRLAQAACAVGLTYAAVSVYWAAGGTWLLDTVGGTLAHPGGADGAGLMVAVWAAAVLKVIGALVPLAAAGLAPWPPAVTRRRQVRAVAWAEAGILTSYGLVLAGAGWLQQAGVIATPASADHRALAWHAYLWDPWFLLWGLLVTAALLCSRRPGLSR
jgi:hypothetical protein